MMKEMIEVMSKDLRIDYLELEIEELIFVKMFVSGICVPG